NRVQPGQAVVNYRVMPDVDGDGVDELVVVNTASVAPNDDVISDPVSQAQISSISTPFGPGGGGPRAQGDGISGPPGTLIELEATGFNPASALGNVATFRSSLSGTELEVPAFVMPDLEGGVEQTVLAPIPLLPPGPATLTLRNESTEATVGPIDITVEAASPPGEPPEEIIDEALAIALDSINQMADLAADEGRTDLVEIANRARDETNELRTLIQEISEDPTPEEEQFLIDLATMLENSNIAGRLAGIMQALREHTPLYECDNLDPIALLSAGIGGLGAGLMSIGSAKAALLTLAGATFGAGVLLVGFAAGLAIGVAIACWPDDDPPATPPAQPQPSPGNGGNGTMGMGSAPPPGGYGWGNGNGAQGGLSTVSDDHRASAFPGEPGRIMIKVYSNGVPTVFTGMTDAGGYFFIPLIPAGEEFVAVATDTVTGETRTVEGIGPPTGEGVAMFFDFFSEEVAADTVYWDGGGDGSSWHDPFNWNPNTMPGATQHVVIDVPGDVTVTHSRK
ncbi:MAG: hypothetical protein ACRDIB_02480, partial [Ardenticatenaceae bacterium]